MKKSLFSQAAYSCLALFIVIALPLVSPAKEKTDFNALKNHGKNITAWLNKVSDKQNTIAPADIVRSAYSSSSSSTTPYESIRVSIEFYDSFAAEEAKSSAAEDQVIAQKAKAISERLKRIKRGLAVAKKADSSTVSKSLETSQGYRELLNLRAKGPQQEINFDEIVIAAAKKAHRKAAETSGAAGSVPKAGAQ